MTIKGSIYSQGASAATGQASAAPQGAVVANTIHWPSTDHLITVLFLVATIAKALLPQRGGRLVSFARDEAELIAKYCGPEPPAEQKKN